MTPPSRRTKPLATGCALLLPMLNACGGGSPSAPGPVPTPSPTAPASVHDVAVVVFYDQNHDGRLDRNEDVRVPDATVEIAGRTGVSERVSGRAMIAGVPDGPQDVVAPIDGLPPFFVSAPRGIVVPTSADVNLPVTLPIGRNRPHRYMAVGDSITVGDGSNGGQGYPGRLESQLARHFGQAVVVNRGVTATDTREGLRLIRDQLQAERPAYTLIHYGTNDWLHCAGQIPCYTVDNLRRMVEAVRGPQSLPCLATIIPVNPKLNSAGRNNWIHNIDARIRDLAAAQGAVLVDLEAAFLRESDLSSLFSDHVHPNDRGYKIMADEFFRAITRPRGTSTSASGVEL
jgi:lysophospholipase L1-like esterase